MSMPAIVEYWNLTKTTPFIEYYRKKMHHCSKILSYEVIIVMEKQSKQQKYMEQQEKICQR